MSVNTRSEGRTAELARELNDRRPTITPADLLLCVIPVLLAGGLFVAWISGLSVHGALLIACLPALVTTGYALFYDPPATDDREN